MAEPKPKQHQPFRVTCRLRRIRLYRPWRAQKLKDNFTQGGLVGVSLPWAAFFRPSGAAERPEEVARCGGCGAAAGHLRKASTCAANASGWSSMMKWNELSMRTRVLFGSAAKLSRYSPSTEACGM